jgi:hypothetical protein
MSAPIPGFDSIQARIAKAAQDYAKEFIIPLEEVREWYRNSDDKPGLVEYMERMVKIEHDWRRKVYRDYQARKAACPC